MHSLIAYRVLGRFLCRADLMGDPKALFAQLGDMKRELDFLQVYLPELLDGEAIIAVDYRARWKPSPEQRPVIQKLQDAESKMSVGQARAVRGLGAICNPLFLAILQTLALPKTTRRKVEQQSRKWVRKKSPKIKGRESEVYLATKGIVDEAYETAKEALEVGEPIGSESEIQVGSFKLVNTGGFKPDVMQDAAEAMNKAEGLLRSKGFGKVCYGEVYVTKTLHGSSNVGAFYMPPKDALFVRANFRQPIDLVHNIIHELAHRLDHKFLQGKQREINKLYGDLAFHKQWLRPTDIPKPLPGDEIPINRKPHIIDRVLGPKIYVRKPDEPSPSNSYISMDTYRVIKNELAGKPPWGEEGFPSEYASRSPGENFAEMVTGYCLGKLAPKLREALESIIG